MVGIRDRAGRCINCKQRKIKCDLSRPACARCRHLGLGCEYLLLRKGDVFLNRTVTSPFHQVLDTSSIVDDARPCDTVRKCRQTHGKLPSRICGESRIAGLLFFPDPSPEYRMQLLSSFMGLYLPTGAQRSPISGRTPASWVHLLASSTLQSSAYNASLVALCMAQLGMWNRDQVKLHEGVKLYASALHELRSSIKTGVRKDPEATLASIVVLLTYETFSSSPEYDGGWISHVRGGSRLLQLLGPGVLKTEIGRQLFARIRTNCIFEALKTRKTSIIAGMEFFLGDAHSSGPSPFDCLQGLMIKLPYIMEAFDILAQKIPNVNGVTERDGLVDLLRSCFQINGKLLLWRKTLNYELNDELYTVVSAVAQNPADDETTGRVFPLAIQFPTLNVAQLMLLYWSTMLLLYRTIGDIQRLLEARKDVAKYAVPNLDLSAAQRLLLPAEARVYQEVSNQGLPLDKLSLRYALPESIILFAANICQSVEYCYRSKNGTLGLQSTVFPIWAAEDFYTSQLALYREWQWCREIGNMTAPDSRFDLKVMKLNNSS